MGATFLAKELGQPSVLTVLNCTCPCASQNAEVTRQMTVARAAQDEVENVKKEMQDKLKAAQDSTSQQVAHKPHTHTLHTHTLPLPDVSVVCLSYTSLSSCMCTSRRRLS